MKFQALYLPIGVSTFDMVSADIQFRDSVDALRKVDKNIICPDEIILDLKTLGEFISDKSPDIVIVQNVTFANGAYISEVLRSFDCHIILWSLPEPVIDGSRLRLNSLAGAFSAANTLMSFERNFSYVHGNAYDTDTMDKISAVIKAAKLKTSLSKLNLLQIGHTPEGFGFGGGNDNAVMKNFGVKLYSIETRELMEKAREYDDDEIRDFIFDAQRMIPNLFNIERQNVFDAGRLFKAYFDYCNNNNIGAVASKCWPDFFTEYKTPVCAVLSVLNDLGIPTACEADTYGALSIYICQYLSSMPSFFGELVSMNESSNDVTLWHCGMAPTTLANESTGAQVGVHFNRNIGPTLDFGCRGSRHATIFRLGRKSDGSFRFFIATGEAPDRLKQFTGTTIVVKTDSPVKNVVESAVKSGWEPHFAVAMADISKELEALADMFGIEIERY